MQDVSSLYCPHQHAKKGYVIAHNTLPLTHFKQTIDHRCRHLQASPPSLESQLDQTYDYA